MTFRTTAINLASHMCGFSFLPALARKLTGRKGVTILSYHGVIDTPMAFEEWCMVHVGQFRRQMAYLKNNFDVVSLSSALEILAAGEAKRPTAVITFDDGFQNNFDVAFPILTKLNLPATIFLVTDRIGTDRALWFCRVDMALEATRKKELHWEGHFFDLSTSQGKTYAAAWLQESFKGLPFERLLCELTNLQNALGVSGETPVPRHSPFRMLDLESIRAMQASGLIEFGGHTHTHAILSRLSPEQQYEQIFLSKQGVEELAERPCRFFAYPNGAPSDHDSTTTRMLTKCGMVAAVNMEHGLNRHATNHLHLRRYGIGSDTCLSRFKLMAHGFT